MDMNISLAVSANCTEWDPGVTFGWSALGIEDFFFLIQHIDFFKLGVKVAEERKDLEKILEVEMNEDSPQACLKYSFPGFLQYSAMETLSEYFLPTKLHLFTSNASTDKHAKWNIGGKTDTI